MAASASETPVPSRVSGRLDAVLLGAGLGYARAYSGGLALPIALHFLHNFAVLLIDHALPN